MRSQDEKDRDIPREAEHAKEREAERGVPRADHVEEGERDLNNPPHTTTDGFTAPKFGSAVSGGGDIEPAPGT